ncbi:polygalacturonase ADPG2-like [Panicum hallii]|uniref:polygalacturonase ADPG2-like n=1 Tax=Panicum hallii TaxID=206008 RepID=UPI000DF4EA90|nr:polygalacturonase ADPG2-like [Panicum hallii]
MAAMTRALLLLFALAIRSAGGQQRVHNVIDFHAAGDGKTDDAQVSDSCHCSKGVPGDMASGLQRRGRAGHGRPRGRAFLLSQVSFQGPCKSPITVKAANLLTFLGVDHLTLDGNGGIDGQGAIWWDCYNRKKCHARPILLGFARVQQSNGEKDTSEGQCRQAHDLVPVQPGDDCVSVLSYTKNITVTQSRVGRVTPKGFLFQSLNMTEVQYPIVIDQFYCPQGNCPIKHGGVAISDARFIDIQGTSSEQEAIRLLCSQSVHCQGIYLSNINLSWVNHTSPANATILNAHGSTGGMVVPRIQFSDFL